MDGLPTQTDSPATIRQYLSTILSTDHMYSQEQAQEAASSWELGTGADLHSLPAQAFVDIFGAQTGWILHEDIARRRRQPEASKDPAARGRCENCKESLLL